MSLLLEALKKAERAKEEAQRRARGDDAAVPPAGAETAPPLSAPLQPEPQPVPLAQPALMTRDQLPDIRQPLTLEGDEPAPARPAAAPREERAPPREAPPAARPQARPDAEASGRASARKVFEAKFKEPNPRLPFYITMGALGVFAVGTVVYFWMQLQPPPALVNTNPPRPSNEAQVAAADLKPTPTPAQQASASTIPGLPGNPPPAALAKSSLQLQPPVQPPTPPAPTASRTPAVPRVEVPRAGVPRAEVPRVEVRRLPPPRALMQTEVTATRAVPQVHPKIASAYAAYLAGDLSTARTEYQHALREEPANRDGLLGLAALDVRAGRFETAEAGYLRLLQADPRDSHALAGLMALRAGRADPLAAESRIKSVLADNPGSHVLNFTLGNQLAQQGRWAEAQQEYFRAFTGEPDNADFAYNLAVSLDHLRQPKLALEYYQRAVALAKTRGARFDLAAAEGRVAQLER